jgi:hypothetical protein
VQRSLRGPPEPVQAAFGFRINLIKKAIRLILKSDNHINRIKQNLPPQQHLDRAAGLRKKEIRLIWISDLKINPI